MLNLRFADFHEKLFDEGLAVYCKKLKEQALKCSKGSADHEHQAMFCTYAVHI